MLKPRICLALVENDLKRARENELLVDFYEVRLDLVGPGWTELVKGLKKPWIACNRRQEEGGRGPANEDKRAKELMQAIDAGAAIVDIELQSARLSDLVPEIKARTKCLVSYHDMVGTPSAGRLKEIVEKEIGSSADICKIVTTARKFEDNVRILQLFKNYPERKLVAFAMGDEGKISRILSPLAGGYFTYASAEGGKESAAGQIPVKELHEIYACLGLPESG